MKKYLDSLVKRYETKDFIDSDPIRFAHRFKKREDVEIAGFISALFAYGQRTVFIKKLEILFGIMQNRPLDFLFDWPKNSGFLSGFNYRFSKEDDVKVLIETLSRLYKSGNSLYELFKTGYSENKNLREAQTFLADYFYKYFDQAPSQGLCHLLSHPKHNGAQKRVNMFLRWMVRDGQVDLGIWDFIKKSELQIPLDTHVARISRDLKILNRKSNDYKAVVELTEKLKEFDPDDPAKYDFAMFGFGIANEKK